MPLCLIACDQCFFSHVLILCMYLLVGVLYSVQHFTWDGRPM